MSSRRLMWGRSRSFAIAACTALLLVLVAGPAGAVDANSASSEDLQTVRGIGPAMAARIVEERRKGMFRDADDLRERVRGIGPRNLEKMQAAGLEVRAGHSAAQAIGSARVQEVAPRAGGDAAPAPMPRARVEYHVGRAR